MHLEIYNKIRHDKSSSDVSGASQQHLHNFFSSYFSIRHLEKQGKPTCKESKQNKIRNRKKSPPTKTVKIKSKLPCKLLSICQSKQWCGCQGSALQVDAAAPVEAGDGRRAEALSPEPAASSRACRHAAAMRNRTYLSSWFLRLRQSSPIRSGRPNQNEILFSLHCPQIRFQSDCSRR